MVVGSCPLLLIGLVRVGAGTVTGGRGLPWIPEARKVDVAEVCCGLATWSWVARGGGLEVGPVLDCDS